MKLLRHIRCAALLLLLGLQTSADSFPLATELQDRQFTLEAIGNGRDQLALTLRNPSPTVLTVAIPAGLIAQGEELASRVVVLRAARVEIPARGAVEVALPVAALAMKNAVKRQAFTLTTTSEPRLDTLLKTLADQPDAPRPTTQLAVLCLLDDVTFGQWRQFLGTSADAQPTPAEVTQAIDALGLLRTIEPQRSFSLASDAGLKSRALRNPWSRAKAMAIYGLDLGDGAVPPDLRQLLHTQAGDNCPICRQRTLMEKQAKIP